MAFGVATSGGFLADCKRFLRCSSSDRTFEYTYNLVSLPRCRGLEFSYCHFLSDVAVKVDGFTFCDRDKGLLPLVCLSAEKTALGPAAAIFASYHCGVYINHFNAIELLDQCFDLVLVGFGRNPERIAVELLSELSCLLGHDGCDCNFQCLFLSVY